MRIMTIPVTKFEDEVAREQFEAFETREKRLRTEERRERAARLKLPVDFSRSSLPKYSRNPARRDRR
jgi:hypothetical protein